MDKGTIGVVPGGPIFSPCLRGVQVTAKKDLRQGIGSGGGLVKAVTGLHVAESE